MAGQRGALLLVALARRIIAPQLKHIIAATGDEATLDARRGARAHEAARRRGGGPRHAVDAHAVRREELLVDGVVAEFEDGDGAVGGGAGEQAAGLVRRPG